MLILHFFFTFLQIDAIFSIFVYDFSEKFFYNLLNSLK